MRVLAPVFAVVFVAFAAAAAATSDPPEPMHRSPGAVQAAEQAAPAGPLVAAEARSEGAAAPGAADPDTLAGEIAALKRQIGAILAETQAGATEFVRSAPGAGSLSVDQIAGIGIGIVAGALIADALGGSGIVVAAVATGGGMLGNWIAGEL